MDIAIIGTGNIGAGLVETLAKAGNRVIVAGKSAADGPELAAKVTASSRGELRGATVAEAVQQAEIVILALPYGAIDAIAREAAFDGKIVVDLSNPVKEDFSGISLGFTTSAAEQVQALLPAAQVVKAFNTVFAQVYGEGLEFGDRKVPTFIASDHDVAKAKVMEMAADAGFDPVDAGPLRNARYLEPLGYLNIQFGYMLGHGTQIVPAWLSREAA